MRLRTTFVHSQRVLRAFDWLLAAGSLGWGIHTMNLWWIAGGIIGFGLAWYDPGTRLRKRFDFTKPRPTGGA